MRTSEARASGGAPVSPGCNTMLLTSALHVFNMSFRDFCPGPMRHKSASVCACVCVSVRHAARFGGKFKPLRFASSRAFEKLACHAGAPAPAAVLHRGGLQCRPDRPAPSTRFCVKAYVSRVHSPRHRRAAHHHCCDVTLAMVRGARAMPE